MTFTLSRPSALALNSPTIQHFPQGFTIIAEQIPVDAVNLSLWANVGSAVEPDRINGMAHFLEHMVFKGTERLEIGEFERSIEERGAVTNAATSQDYTHYYITTAPKDFAALAPLQFDVVFNLKIDEDAFEREKLVVLEEIRRSQDSPQRRSFQRAMQVAFEALPYRRPVLGSVEAIEALSAQQMRDFHGTWYQPSAITAVAVGNLPVEELIETVASSFLDAAGDRFPASATNFSIPQFYTPTPEPAFEEIVRREYVDESLQQARLIVMWRVPGMMQLEETYALDVLSAILGKGRTGRLTRQLREEEGLVSSIGAGNMSHRLQGIFQISAHLPAENLDAVEAKVVEQIRTLQTQPIRESELAKIRTQVANRFIFGNETPSDRANLYGYFNSTVGDLNPAIDYPKIIQRLDLDDLQRAAQEYLSPEAYGVVIIRPKS